MNLFPRCEGLSTSPVASLDKFEIFWWKTKMFKHRCGEKVLIIWMHGILVLLIPTMTFWIVVLNIVL